MVYVINYFIFVSCLTNKLIIMENEKNLTPEESLQLISKTISSIKEDFKRDNYYFVIWGWIISLASLSQFVMLRVLLSKHSYEHINLYSWLIWGILIAAGVFIVSLHRYKNAVEVKSYIGKFFYILWQCTGVAIILAVLISQKLHVYPNPFVLTIAGLATLISGRLIKFKPLIFGGIAFFIFAITASFFNNEYQLIFVTVAIIIGYLVPGYLLKSPKN